MGYREGVNGHEALRALMKYSNQFPNGATLEIDLRKYFNTIPHDKLQGILSEKITDKRFLKLVEKVIRAPVMVNGKAELNRLGVPQGSVASPILSNIYLHHVVDNWFSEISKSHLKGKTEMVRFADDMVFVFQTSEDAERFYKVLPKRLEKYGLKLHEEKSSLLKSGRKEAEEAAKRGAPTDIQILGISMLLGQGSTRSMALEIQEPIRSNDEQTQRSARLSQEKPKSRNFSHHKAGQNDCVGMDKLSRYLRQSKASKFVHSNE
jgi:Reverse transcriptase (RNA-dependent DNA polymerase)